jgi:hypothetical protein
VVDDRITDGERIAQLLASELSGLAVGPLADVTVTDANPDATPTESGTLAYALALEDERTGEVYMYPDRVRVELDPDVVLTVDSGAAVKRAVDAVREAFRDAADG